MLTRYDPFFAEDALSRLAFGAFAPWLAQEPFAAMPTGMPPADLIETKDAFEIVCDVPGAGPSDVEVTAQDKWIVLKGRRTTASGASVEFMRSFQLDGCATDGATASLEGGVLHVRVPKGVTQEPKRIAVSGGAPALEGSKPGFFDRIKRALSGVVRPASS